MKRREWMGAACGALTMMLAAAGWAGPAEQPYKVPAKIADVAEATAPANVRIDGWLGERIAVNEKNRLLTVDTEPLLAGFRSKPGTHPWIGEHVGKWLHAATLAWANTGDEALKAKLDKVAAELIGCQEADGYLGTYVKEKRFGQYKGADWDVWSHKYNLIGLLTYYQYTGNEAALQACRKMGDLLVRTFPAEKSIIAAGTHVGMASTSVLEPMALLYRLTGDERYLEFCRYIVKSWDEEKGPKIIATLLELGRVDKVANAKAYEMMSNLVGLCELARATGDASLLKPAMIAWEDVSKKRIYITGGASYYEHFHDDYDLPNQVSARVGETCVTTTWIQLSWQLLRLTGEAKYGTELERAIYNQLAAAQHPDGSDWCYYTALEGRKPYDKGITCCHSSGPRGMALAPLTAYWRIKRGADEALAISTLESSKATLELGGQAVTVEQASGFPREGKATITLRMKAPARFAVQVRIPEWSPSLNVKTGETVAAAREGWATIPAREWKDGDLIEVAFELKARLVVGAHGNKGKAALVYGPFVLAYDQEENPKGPAPAAIGLTENSAKGTLEQEKGDQQKLVFECAAAGRKGAEKIMARLTPFADAGADGNNYRVWLRAPGVEAGQLDSALMDGKEGRSRKGNLKGSIVDDDPQTVVETFAGAPEQEAWFAVELASPAKIKRVVFMHGKNFHDGGWFDASAGKPKVQVKVKNKGEGTSTSTSAGEGEWVTVGELGDYPATTATNNAKLQAGQAFTVKLKEPVEAVAVRVVGRPACGDKPKQAFASCGELQAFGE